jgi:hypothetical protein
MNVYQLHIDDHHQIIRSENDELYQYHHGYLMHNFQSIQIETLD